MAAGDPEWIDGSFCMRHTSLKEGPAKTEGAGLIVEAMGLNKKRQGRQRAIEELTPTRLSSMMLNMAKPCSPNLDELVKSQCH